MESIEDYTFILTFQERLYHIEFLVGYKLERRLVIEERSCR